MQQSNPRYIYGIIGARTRQQSTLSNQPPKEESCRGELTPLGSPDSSSRDDLSVYQQRELRQSPGRFRQPLRTADERDQPMRETNGRQRRDNNKITVVYASYLYCTVNTPSPSKGDTAYVPPSTPRGDRVYNSTSELAGVVQ